MRLWAHVEAQMMNYADQQHYWSNERMENDQDLERNASATINERCRSHFLQHKETASVPDQNEKGVIK